jgi:hypothetical protein
VPPSWLAGMVRALGGVADPFALRFVSEAPQGVGQQLQRAATAGDLPDGPEPAREGICATGTPAEPAADQPRPAQLPEATAGDCLQDNPEAVADAVFLAPERWWPAEERWLLALAAGGAAWHLQRRPLPDAEERSAAANAHRNGRRR